MKNKKIIIPIVVVLAAAILISVVFLVLAVFLPVKSYTDKTPEIIANPTVLATHDETLSVEDLCTIECKGSYTTRIVLLTSTIDDAAVSDDKQSIYVGSTADEIQVSLVTGGENAESTSAVVRILVDLD